ncbi:MAG: hypothetical protein HOO06_14680 [Bdellovibrionaceae bacterium]|jgi:hypothetical protein|nr:hypothetical protein [Pseudobdellovibrionaceae bacterium]
MNKFSVITQVFIFLSMNMANASTSLQMDDIKTMGSISCMNLIYTVSKIHEVKSKQKNKLKPLFNNVKLSKRITLEYSSVVAENRKNKKSSQDSLQSMFSVYNKLAIPIQKADKSFTTDCETYYIKAFKECKVLSNNKKMEEGCIRNSLKKRKMELTNLQNRIFRI